MKHKHYVIVRHVFVCSDCGWNWEQPFDVDEYLEVRCPDCKSIAPSIDVLNE